MERLYCLLLYDCNFLKKVAAKRMGKSGYACRIYISNPFYPGWKFLHGKYKWYTPF